jgi:hypothetical protein
MRLFEALIFAFAGQAVLALAVMGAARPRWMSLFPLAALVPLAAHLLLEVPRWQMIPAYLVAVGGAVMGIAGYRKQAGPKGAAAESQQPRGIDLIRVAGMAGVVLLAASVVLTTSAAAR